MHSTIFRFINDCIVRMKSKAIFLPRKFGDEFILSFCRIDCDTAVRDFDSNSKLSGRIFAFTNCITYTATDFYNRQKKNNTLQTIRTAFNHTLFYHKRTKCEVKYQQRNCWNVHNLSVNTMIFFVFFALSSINFNFIEQNK